MVACLLSAKTLPLPMCHTSSEALGPTPQMTPTLTIITGTQTGIDTVAIEAATRLQLPYEVGSHLGTPTKLVPSRRNTDHV
jgi:hypothetical protein